MAVELTIQNYKDELITSPANSDYNDSIVVMRKDSTLYKLQSTYVMDTWYSVFASVGGCMSRWSEGKGGMIDLVARMLKHPDWCIGKDIMYKFDTINEMLMWCLNQNGG